MLSLSAHGDYGLLLLRALASAKSGQYVSLAKLAQERHLPRKYLDHVAKQLVVAGVIVAREGRAGGYALRKPVEEIRFVEVLEALEGSLGPTQCTHDGECCERQAACERKTGWQALHKELFNLLKSKTLADVLSAAAKY
ncbi:MAG: Rrf2 family transcriptional regulator [Candidatus Veblenbacteria bacterium]|nr:Rrf2 family transcriptional regulator [Candidatus Veblenbacteria bacterium]